MATVKEDLVERVGQALEAALPEGTTIITKTGTRKAKGGGDTTAKVSKSKAKQDDLPTMQDHQRRIAEIEDAGDKQLDLEDQVKALKEKLKDADDELVASMKRHDRTFYHRQTWGKVILKESKTHARVTKSTPTTVVDSDGEDASPDSEE
jgi:hypothetical protein